MCFVLWEAFSQHTSFHLIPKKNVLWVSLILISLIPIIPISQTKTLRLNWITCPKALRSIPVPLTIKPISITLYNGYNIQKQPWSSGWQKNKAHRSQEAKQCFLFFVWSSWACVLSFDALESAFNTCWLIVNSYLINLYGPWLQWHFCFFILVCLHMKLACNYP